MARNGRNKLRMDPSWSDDDLNGLDFVSNFGPFGIIRSILTGKTPTIPGVATISGKVRQGVDSAFNWIADKASGLWDEFKNSNIYRKYTGSGLTDAEREANAWTAQREDTANQRSVADMQAAGLNPYMMYGGSAGATSTSGSVSPGSASMPSILPAILQMLSLPTQLSAIRAQTERTRAEAEGIRIDNETRGSKNVLEIKNLQSALKNDRVRRALDRQGISESKARESLDLAQVVLAGIDAESRADLNDATIQLAYARRAWTWRSSDLMKHQIDETDARTANLWQDSILKSSQAYAADANAALSAAMKGESEARTDSEKKRQELLDAQTKSEFARLGILVYDEKARKWEVDHQSLKFWSDIVNKTFTTAAAAYGAYSLGTRSASSRTPYPMEYDAGVYGQQW